MRKRTTEGIARIQFLTAKTNKRSTYEKANEKLHSSSEYSSESYEEGFVDASNWKEVADEECNFEVTKKEG